MSTIGCTGLATAPGVIFPLMSREGLTIASQTLWDQLEALATVLQPTYEALAA